MRGIHTSFFFFLRDKGCVLYQRALATNSIPVAVTMPFCERRGIPPPRIKATPPRPNEAEAASGAARKKKEQEWRNVLLKNDAGGCCQFVSSPQKSRCSSSLGPMIKSHQTKAENGFADFTDVGIDSVLLLVKVFFYVNLEQWFSSGGTGPHVVSQK